MSPMRVPRHVWMSLPSPEQLFTENAIHGSRSL